MRNDFDSVFDLIFRLVRGYLKAILFLGVLLFLVMALSHMCSCTRRFYFKTSTPDVSVEYRDSLKARIPLQS